ncbi:MAG: PAS-domain containing protein [Rhodobacteraceae bacterium]|nr:PAS-domain containing protein [Paracoccaceae bacterium]
MIDPDDPLEVQLEKQRRIIDALIRRSERRHEVGDNAYALFQSAMSLQSEVWKKTRDLEEALDSLGQTSRDLEAARIAQETLQKNLAEAMDTMEGGFALFTDSRLQVCNTLFRRLLPDVEPLIGSGLDFGVYMDAVQRSRFVRPDAAHEVGPLADSLPKAGAGRFASYVLPLRNDRWFQISHHQTSDSNVVVLQTEITDIVRENRRQKAQLIDRHGQFLQAAFDHMSLGICAFSAQGTLLVRNDRFGDLLGVPLRLLKPGTDIRRILGYLARFDLLDRESTQLDTEGWLRAMFRGQAAHGRFRRSDRMCLDLRVRPLPEGGFVVSIMDITAEADAAADLERRVEERTAELTEANRLLEIKTAEQARSEEALRVAKEAAEAANRSKTRFIAAASHDLLQPINAAKLYISNLLESEMPAPALDKVERLRRSFSSIETLLHAILDISRLDSPGTDFNITDFPIGQLLESVASDLGPLAEKKGIGLHVVPCRHWVTSDRRYLGRSIQNLVVNAIQYTDAGRVLVGCRHRGDRLVLQVSDTGIGIAPEDSSRIFNEFTRVGKNSAGGGMGLGLSIVERACRHLHHPLKLVSVPGRGSTFTIEVPLASAAALGEDGPSVHPGDRIRAFRLIVLVVENDPDVLDATTGKLESWGASVLGAASTAGAVALMQEIGTPPDIILADYHLDGEDTGLETIRTLRDIAGQTIPAVLITADRSKAVQTTAERMQVSVLTKPVQLARLRSLIDWKTRAQVA